MCTQQVCRQYNVGIGLEHQRIMLTFKGTLQAGGLGQEESHDVLERKISTFAEK